MRTRISSIILGGYIVVNDLMPVSLVAVSIYCGMMGSDFALYGIGAAARHLPWLSCFAVDERVIRFGDTLKRNVFGWSLCAGWCRAWCSWLSSPAAGRAFRSPAFPSRAWLYRRSICR